MRCFFFPPNKMSYALPHGFDSWVGKIPWRRKWQPTPVFLLENPKDRGAWQATVHRITKSWARLKWLSTALPILKADKNKAALFKVRIRSWELYPSNTSLPPFSFHIYLLRESLHPEIPTKTVEMSVWEKQMGPDGEEVEYYIERESLWCNWISTGMRLSESGEQEKFKGNNRRKRHRRLFQYSTWTSEIVVNLE